MEWKSIYIFEDTKQLKLIIMTNAQALSTEQVREMNIRIVNNLETMIPIKENGENPYNGRKHSAKDLEFKNENSSFYDKFSSKEMKESLNYFKSKI